MMWRQREIENYFCEEKVLMAYAVGDQHDDLFGVAQKERRTQAMRESIVEVTRLLEIDELVPWSPDVKASDEVLDRVLRLYFKKLELPLHLRKSEYHLLARLVPKERLDTEIAEKLTAIVEVAGKARPRED